MRISDWSSDVCSSDLGLTPLGYAPAVFDVPDRPICAHGRTSPASGSGSIRAKRRSLKSPGERHDRKFRFQRPVPVHRQRRRLFQVQGTGLRRLLSDVLLLIVSLSFSFSVLVYPFLLLPLLRQAYSFFFILSHLPSPFFPFFL